MARYLLLCKSCMFKFLHMGSNSSIWVVFVTTCLSIASNKLSSFSRCSKTVSYYIFGKALLCLLHDWHSFKEGVSYDYQSYFLILTSHFPILQSFKAMPENIWSWLGTSLVYQSKISLLFCTLSLWSCITILQDGALRSPLLRLQSSWDLKPSVGA